MAHDGKYSRLLVLVGIIAAVAALYFAKSVLVLFAIAFLLAFLLAPLVHRIQRLGLPRVLAVVVVMAFALSIAVGVGWVVVNQLNDLVKELPTYRENLREKFSFLREKLGDPLERAQKTVADIASRPESSPAKAEAELKVVSPARSELDTIAKPLGHLIEIGGAIGIVILLGAVMLIQKEDMRDRLIRLTGAGQYYVTTRAFDEASAKVSRYLMLTTLLNATHGVCIGTGLFFLGIPNALLWGLLAALLRFIPYIGPWISAAFPITIALARFPGWDKPLMTGGLVLFLELVSNNILEPWIYGSRTGVSPGALIIAAVFWTWIWGAAGLFLATPLTVCLAVMGKYVPPLRFLHVIFGDEPVLSAQERLYQRLLAGDADEAWEIIGKELENKSRIEVSDTVLIPALALAERERHFGALDAATFATVAERMTVLVDEVEDYQHAGKDKTPDQTKPAVDAMPHAPDEESPPVPILCIAAEDEADGVVATMADRALRRMGYVPTLISSSALTGELPLKVEELKAPVVLISNLPPSGFAQVRYICKRLAGKFEQIHVIIGIWGANLDARKARERLPKDGNFYFVTSLAEGMRQAHELYRTFSLQPELKGDDTTVTEPPALRGSASKPG